MGPADRARDQNAKVLARARAVTEKFACESPVNSISARRVYRLIDLISSSAINYTLYV